MPPRYAYWTILVGDQPTAFRSGSQEDLMPTFKRIQAKSPDAKMMWFQNGKLWPSRIDAQEAMRARGEMGRRGDDRQAGGFRDRERKPDWKSKTDARPRTARSEKPEWKPRSGAESSSRPKSQDPRPKTSEKLDWKPKGEFTPAPKRSEKPDWKPKAPFDRERKPEWRSKTQDSRPRTPRSARPDWKPSGDDTKSAKPEWKPKGSFTRERKPEWKSKTQDARPKTSRSEKLDWKPRTESGTGNTEPGTVKRKWVPKAEYKKSLGIEAKRDAKWRPGGEHRDPRQKYKDAKKAKWTKFKTTIRTKWETKKKKP